MTDAVDTASEGERRYERELIRRRRRLTAQWGARAFVVQATWIVILAAGAAVPLATALEWDDSVGPVLGFVVVVATGVERIFGRTTQGAVAVDELRRRLDRERRLLDTRRMEYAETDDPFGLFVARSEEAIDQYDRTMVEYGARLTRDSDE
jgi:hypothetical protein